MVVLQRYFQLSGLGRKVAVSESHHIVFLIAALSCLILSFLSAMVISQSDSAATILYLRISILALLLTPQFYVDFVGTSDDVPDTVRLSKAGWLLDLMQAGVLLLAISMVFP
ncbi:hypothetical protein PS2015_2927 [Pseudohongiella spirulinae]|uniref:Uncharacterized protein n=1 Tax=Pseudohongiella spirulinae TaxID=1249552 RepID=A0A0S2KHZ3_9GAMM|nr:hypothetical protein PS2015_2927 [Pseudohongiella spirulinae]